MPTYLVTGASRGLGFAFVKELSADAGNTVIGLVRNKIATDKKVAAELGSPGNVHILEADITNYDALKESVQAVSKMTGGALDYVIANAALIPSWSAWDAVDVLAQDPKLLEKEILDTVKVNVIGNVHLFNLYVPLVLKGKAKKVVAISSGMSDVDFIRQFDIEPAAPYAVSKAGASVITAKFAARYAKDGVLFMSICPGSVNSGFEGERKCLPMLLLPSCTNKTIVTEEQTQKALRLASKFVNYAPDFKGPSSPEDSAKAVLSVMHAASLENGSSGSFVSRYGNKQWM